MTNKKKIHTITLDEYASLMEDYLGFCTECGAFRDCVEPDAARYECEECGENTVYGTDTLLMMGLVTEPEPKKPTNRMDLVFGDIRPGESMHDYLSNQSDDPQKPQD